MLITKTVEDGTSGSLCPPLLSTPCGDPLKQQLARYGVIPHDTTERYYTEYAMPYGVVVFHPSTEKKTLADVGTKTSSDDSLVQTFPRDKGGTATRVRTPYTP